MRLFCVAGNHPRQAGHAQHVRVPRVQDQDPRSHLRLDLQSKDQRQARKVDSCWRCTAAADLIRLRPNSFFLHLFSYGFVFRTCFSMVQSDCLRHQKKETHANVV